MGLCRVRDDVHLFLLTALMLTRDATEFDFKIVMAHFKASMVRVDWRAIIYVDERPFCLGSHERVLLLLLGALLRALCVRFFVIKIAEGELSQLVIFDLFLDLLGQLQLVKLTVAGEAEDGLRVLEPDVVARQLHELVVLALELEHLDLLL